MTKGHFADKNYIAAFPGDSVAIEDPRAGSGADSPGVVEVLQAQGLAWHAPQTGAIVEWQTYADQASLDLVDEGIVSEPLYEALIENLTAYRESVD